jgi:hypothetical protein
MSFAEKPLLNVRQLFPELGHTFDQAMEVAPPELLDFGRNFRLLSLLSAGSLILAACASGMAGAATQTSLVNEPTPIVQMTEEAPTESVTESVTATVEVPHLGEMPMDEAAWLLLSGEVSYPVEFNNQQRAELAIAIANEINQNIVPDEVYVDTDQGRVVWDAAQKRWRAYQNSEEAGTSAESLPPLVVAGYTNTEGQEVFIDHETGVEVVIPRIQLPELGEVSISELYLMNPKELQSYFVDLMLNAGVPENTPGADIAIRGIRQNFPAFKDSHISLPIITYEYRSQGNEFAYTNFDEFNNTLLTERPTVSALAPMLDRNTNTILGWLNIQSGLRTYVDAFLFSDQNLIFGAGSSRQELFPQFSFGVLMPAETTDTLITHDDGRVNPDYQYGIPLLENGENIGDADEIVRIVHADISEIISIFEETRLAVLYPRAIITRNTAQ